MWRGEWDEAEHQLTTARSEFATFRAPMAGESIVRLAELRWRQGRWDEATELFRQVEHEGIAQPGRAELALSMGEAAAAAGYVERYLRQLPLEDRMERAGGLELMVRSLAAAGSHEAALAPLAELRANPQHAGNEAAESVAAFASGDAGRRAGTTSMRCETVLSRTR